MFQCGIDTKIVKEITGHSSDAVAKYQVTSNNQKREVSVILKGQKALKFIDNGKESDGCSVTEESKHITPVPSLELAIT